jgi:hypothetical protein
MAVISLRGVVNEMQAGSDEVHAYLNTVTGELLSITDEDMRLVEEREIEDDLYDIEEDIDDIVGDLPDWQQEVVKKTSEVLNSADYVRLPDPYEIHEYTIMESFCMSVDDKKISDTLLDKIHGSGAFRRFKETIRRYNLENAWYKYLDDAYKEIAIDWLEARGIAYQDDMQRK